MKTLYVSDLDGTLLSSENILTENTLNILNALLDNGLHFVIATARNYPSVKEKLFKLHYNKALILSNGAQLTDIYGKPSWIYPWEKTVFSKLLNNLKQDVRYGVYCVYEGEHVWYVHCDMAEGVKYFYDKGQGQCFKKFKSIDTLLDKKLISATLMGSHSVIHHIKSRLDASVLTKTFVNHHMPYPGVKDLTTLSMVPRAINKGIALKAYVDSLAQRPERIVAFGDHLNDCEMLTFADIGVAVGNATPDLKACADHIIAHHDADAVARFIYKLEKENVIL